MNKTSEEIEFLIIKRLGKFLNEQIGEGSENINVTIDDNTVFVLVKNVLFPAEKKLTKTPEGMKSIKELKEKLIETIKPQLSEIIRDITDIKVINVHSDVDTETSEMVIVFKLAENLENKLKKR